MFILKINPNINEMFSLRFWRKTLMWAHAFECAIFMVCLWLSSIENYIDHFHISALTTQRKKRERKPKVERLSQICLSPFSYRIGYGSENNFWLRYSLVLLLLLLMCHFTYELVIFMDALITLLSIRKYPVTW